MQHIPQASLLEQPVKATPIWLHGCTCGNSPPAGQLASQQPEGRRLARVKPPPGVQGSRSCCLGFGTCPDRAHPRVRAPGQPQTLKRQRNAPSDSPWRRSICALCHGTLASGLTSPQAAAYQTKHVANPGLKRCCGAAGAAPRAVPMALPHRMPHCNAQCHNHPARHSQTLFAEAMHLERETHVPLSESQFSNMHTHHAI